MRTRAARLVGLLVALWLAGCATPPAFDTAPGIYRPTAPIRYPLPR